LGQDLGLGFQIKVRVRRIQGKDSGYGFRVRIQKKDLGQGFRIRI
jgi:hypothetical protein